MLTIRYKMTIILLALAWLCLPRAYAQDDGMGQTIQIYTQLTSFTGKPSWMLIIRDIDHNQNIPYVYDFENNNNFWLALTYSRNYLIVASTLQFAPYKADPYRSRVIHNFCGLETHGRIIRGQSLYITISGKLSPYHDTFQCNVLKYADMRFSISNQASE